MEAQINNYRFTSTIATQTVNHGMTSKHSFMIWWSFWFLGINLLRFTAQCSLEKFSASFCTWVVETLVVLFIAPFSQLEHVLLCIVVLYYYTVSYRVSKQPAARDRAAVPRRRPPAGDRVDTMTRYHRTQFFRMKKVFTGQHFHRIAFDSSSQWKRPKLPLLALIQDLKKGL